MTREAELLIDMWDTLHRECHKVVTEENYDVIKKAIKALEQKSIIDKIRAEIEQNAYPIVHGVNNHEKGMTLYGILQVIDKYRGE